MGGVPFALAARFRRVAAPYGIDVIYYLHRYLAVVALGAVGGHAALFLLDDPVDVTLLDPRVGSLHMPAGLASIIALLMSMVRTLAARRDRRPVILFYGYRLWERMTFRDERDRLAARMPFHVVHVLDEPGRGWQRERGRITVDLLDRNLPADRAVLEYFVCGPDAMIRSVERSLHALGVPMSQCHSELFELV